jgi:hypothetical protein
MTKTASPANDNEHNEFLKPILAARLDDESRLEAQAIRITLAANRAFEGYAALVIEKLDALKASPGMEDFNKGVEAAIDLIGKTFFQSTSTMPLGI